MLWNYMKHLGDGDIRAPASGCLLCVTSDVTTPVEVTATRNYVWHCPETSPGQLILAVLVWVLRSKDETKTCSRAIGAL